MVNTPVVAFSYQNIIFHTSETIKVKKRRATSVLLINSEVLKILQFYLMWAVLITQKLMLNIFLAKYCSVESLHAKE